MCNPNKKFYSFLCMSLMFFCFNTTVTYAEEVCPSGYYVEKCSDKIIGTNWLKGFKYEENNVTQSSPNYYDYSMANNMENLRKFFKGKKDIIHTTRNGERVTVHTTDYKPYRNMLLGRECPDKSSTTCAPCPNGGKTEASIITRNIDDNSTSWDLKVISDCYVSKYVDSTGSYEYIESGNSYPTTTASCYYDTESPGDYFIPDDELFPPESQSTQSGQGDQQNSG